MSLINDALKRARETQQNQPPPGAAPLPPVESAARGGAGWMLTLAAVLFVAAAGLILGPALFGHKAARVAVANTAGMPAPTPAAATPAPGAAVAPQLTRVNPPPLADTNPPPAAKTSPPAPVPAVERLPKVQGIIYNAARPLAIVNGQSVNVGDRVGNFQVKQITQKSVVFQRPDGTQKTLGIGD